MAGEHAPKQVPPVTAAKYLRTLGGELQLMIERLHPTGNNAGESHLARATNHANEAASFARNRPMFTERVRIAAKARRTRETLLALEQLVSGFEAERNCWYQAYTNLQYVATQKPPSLNNNEVQLMRSHIRQINDLVQSLPTSEDLPQGNLENMVRGILAVIRAGGFPGAEEIRWEEVIANAKIQAGNGGTVAETSEGFPGTVSINAEASPF